jgi:hypothetical protein
MTERNASKIAGIMHGGMLGSLDEPFSVILATKTTAEPKGKRVEIQWEGPIVIISSDGVREYANQADLNRNIVQTFIPFPAVTATCLNQNNA